MAKVRREAHACTGRGFSKTDPPVYGDNTSGGFLSRVLSFATRPNAHGTTTLITSSTYSTSTFNLVGHGLTTGQSVALTSSGTEAAGFTNSFTLSISLAFPLSRSNYTEYFVIKLTNDTFQLAISHYNARLASPVPITFSADIVAVSVTPLGGGANWYLHDDFSRMDAVTFATTAVNTTDNTITLTGNSFSHNHKVTFSSSGSLPGGLSAGTSYWLVYVSAGVWKVATSEANVYTSTVVDITSQGSGTHTITTAEHFVVLTDTLSPTVNAYNSSPIGCAPKFVKIGYVNSGSGYIRNQCVLWWDKSTHKGEIYWAGGYTHTYDSSIFTYQLIGGDEFLYNAALLGATWTSQFIDTFTGLSSKLEVITKVGVLQSGVTSGSSVVLQLAAGQASNFTVNKWYFIYDLNAHSWLNYVKVTSRDTGADTITVDSISFNFPSGAVVTPYAHRYYHWQASASYLDANMNANYYSNIPRAGATLPYMSQSNSSYAYHNNGGAITLGCFFTSGNDQYISRGIPDDEGYYDCIKYVIGDGDATDNAGVNLLYNRLFGKTNNYLRTARGSMGQMSNYRTLNGVDYLYSSPSPTTYVDMIRYSESAS